MGIAEQIIKEKHAVCTAWSKFGGSFTKGLAIALSHADYSNTVKIRTTWPEYWDEALKQYGFIENREGQ